MHLLILFCPNHAHASWVGVGMGVDPPLCVGGPPSVGVDPPLWGWTPLSGGGPPSLGVGVGTTRLCGLSISCSLSSPHLGKTAALNAQGCHCLHRREGSADACPDRRIALETRTECQLQHLMTREHLVILLDIPELIPAISEGGAPLSSRDWL